MGLDVGFKTHLILKFSSFNFSVNEREVMGRRRGVWWAELEFRGFLTQQNHIWEVLVVLLH